jgi:hypothetical protein
MEKLFQTADLRPEIQELLKAIEEQHRLMLEMQANLRQLEQDLALARHVQEEQGHKHLEEHPAHTR